MSLPIEEYNVINNDLRHLFGIDRGLNGMGPIVFLSDLVEEYLKKYPTATEQDLLEIIEEELADKITVTRNAIHPETGKRDIIINGSFIAAGCTPYDKLAEDCFEDLTGELTEDAQLAIYQLYQSKLQLERVLDSSDKLDLTSLVVIANILVRIMDEDEYTKRNFREYDRVVRSARQFGSQSTQLQKVAELFVDNVLPYLEELFHWASKRDDVRLV